MVLQRSQHDSCWPTVFGPMPSPCTQTKVFKLQRGRHWQSVKPQPDAMLLVVWCTREALVLRCCGINLGQFEEMIFPMMVFHPSTSFSSSPLLPCLQRRWAVLIQNDKVLAETLTGALLSKNVMVHDKDLCRPFCGSRELCWKMYQLKQMAVVIKQSDC